MESVPALDELLRKLVALNGSDLHLKVGSPPAYRIDGSIHLAELPKLTPDDTKAFATQVMTERAAADFEAHNEADFAYGRASLGRLEKRDLRKRFVLLWTQDQVLAWPQSLLLQRTAAVAVALISTMLCSRKSRT